MDAIPSKAIRTIKFMLPAAVAIGLAAPRPAYACGGMFSPEATIEQSAERIIFSQNGDGTITAIIQIDYVGEADDFAWVLPLPEAIPASAVQVVENGQDAFVELQLATDPQFIPPPRPNCFQLGLGGMTGAPEGIGGRGVDVFSSGATGPYSFDVIGSEDPGALVQWLRDNNYAVTPEMEPLIDPYVQGGMVFLAMRLQPGTDVSSIEPISVTMHADQPMIPLRIAAVAATPDTPIYVWFFSDAQAVPVNFGQTTVPDEAIRFYEYGGNNYRDALKQAIDDAGGQAFVTEYAGASSAFSYNSEVLQELAAEHPYMTRLKTVISPEEMTVDPVFKFDSSNPDVSNVHDLSDQRDAWDIQCITWEQVLVICGLLCGFGVLLIVGLIFVLRRMRRRSEPPT